MRWSQLVATALSIVAMSVSAAAKAPLCFPKGFLLGSATASYQVEGAVNEGGRTPSIWDDWCHTHPDFDCANVADDFYHRYEDDIKMMKDAGHSSFRLSISWSRAMNWDPSTKHMKPNAPGIAFYHSVIDTLNMNNIKPILTIYHWDLPRELQTELPGAGGWLSPEIQDHFVEFSTLLFNEFGHKVEYWTTFNEPSSFVLSGYGGMIIKRAARPPGATPTATVQYQAAHNVLISHAKAVQKFREFKAKNLVQPNAKIGIVLVSENNYPLDPKSKADIEAAERSRQFMVGWWLEPVVSGDYPKVMREHAGDHLPKFTAEQSAMLKGSYDVFMVNHYSTRLATDCDSPSSKTPCSELTVGWMKDLGADTNQKPAGAHPSALDKDGKEVCGYFSAVPEGYRDIIRWTHEHNKSTPILLTENGFCGNEDIQGEDRLWYHQTYLEQVHKAITEDHIPVIGYTAWSLMDNYEWGSYKPRFGLYYVNYTTQVGSKENWTPKSTDLARIPRLAAKWFAKVAQTGCMEPWVKGEQIDEIVPLSTSSVASHGWSSRWWIIAVVVAALAVIAVVVDRHRRRRGYSSLESSPLLH